MATAKTESLVEIRPIEIQKVKVHIEGDTPLIMHKWSEKAKKMMLDAQMGVAKTKKKDPKNPVEDFITSLYWISEEPKEMTMEAFDEAVKNGARFGFPVSAFKQCAISASYRQGYTKDKMSLRGVFFIDEDALSTDGSSVIEIKYKDVIMREDMVKIGMGTADIRYRGELRDWSADLTISFNKNGQYSLEDIINILNAGGFVCGVGEWRPEKDGRNGMFHVDTNA